MSKKTNAFGEIEFHGTNRKTRAKVFNYKTRWKLNKGKDKCKAFFCIILPTLGECVK